MGKDEVIDDDFCSAVESEASTEYLSCGDEYNSDVADLSTLEDEDDRFDMFFACPGEVEEKIPPGAFFGTRDRKVGCRVGFNSTAHPVCKEGKVNLGLVDGSFADEERKLSCA